MWLTTFMLSLLSTLYEIILQPVEMAHVPNSDFVTGFAEMITYINPYKVGPGPPMSVITSGISNPYSGEPTLFINNNTPYWMSIFNPSPTFQDVSEVVIDK